MMRDYLYNDAIPGLEFSCPPIFKSEIFAAIEAGILSEMVERMVRPVKSGSNKVTAVVSRASIRSAGLSLRSFRSTGWAEHQFRPNQPASL